ncbi:hypothetical protein MJO28_001356 [Puccinia striiformis f. sp. tritici]|uniref:Protein YIP n=2 Tax=Puccinia striiformis f. sp. tritici TaxID=168172 RepID=A0A0L0VQQ5_9BASI|nr:hypothetical protein Pst134EA_003384 [Puccinia striiformis f. sp. tritici]KAI9611584.1 hypothetical protein H4Q26_008539 [Puccinia striiformis f. sp. tritici PST-130]KNF01606.1 hypothetical protein PSTG_05038 [Puccinia striiformis f. sp. tritici PST-78]KAH9464954.1 hypothetical protein Pst134EB_004451 [Puccinia striiformis f. sp. tritici]KAH9472780.1 hypothetical protein Pst134EA_003384 [Puccinia striiformis f. sp. tritici]KAI7960867.1 hypothetical protein MJO28_001356 [Puccinia striiformis
MASQGYDIPSPTQAALTVEPDSDDDDDLVAIPESEIEQSSQPLNPTGKSNQKGKTKAYPPAAPPSRPTVSGQIGSTSTANPSNTRQSSRKNFGGIMTESRYGSGINTLDEPISETIMRDLTAIGSKMVLILYPAGSSSSKAVLRDWDLWGPLVACLGLAVVLSLNAPPQQSLSVFTGVFVIVWVGSVIVTLNARLLGGRVSLFQSICVLGYCLFPLFVAALVALFIRWLPIRVLLSVCGWAWSVWAAMNFFGGTRLEDGRAFLAVYPLGLFYAALAWITMLS